MAKKYLLRSLKAEQPQYAMLGFFAVDRGVLFLSTVPKSF